ncbi:MAG: ribonuclease III [Gammaproteobacteria bacterium]|nr:ribonuclease III [Gammaproteobacteria bacterium]NIR32871.1 ribonuclease III [Gammaproteobacteria bacterium]NIR99417.1 ribonuclease III [Gammaproteobacteria bacterium]NIT65031.1 ribonuclease III [Gammaproteobacteria bacterium]NIV21946.1 ribonuclease III [Gammaproteobacteria bacterium]
MSSWEELERDLGYRFRDRKVLKEALTHRSAGGPHNERLEFLGDGVVNFVIAAALYERFPAATEGELSRLRASLVRRDKLAELAQGVELGSHLVMGSGELKSGGYRRESILADGMEALFGAVYLDGGFERCRELILSTYASALYSLPEAATLKDSKTRLQELLQSRRLSLPEYTVVEVAGEAHRRRFRVSCRIPDLEAVTSGSGTSRRKAEQDAAKRALELLAGD